MPPSMELTGTSCMLHLNLNCLPTFTQYTLFHNYIQLYSYILIMLHPYYSHFNHLDCVSPDLTRSLRMWKVSGFHQGQLRMVSFSQSSFTISSSPMSTSVVSKKEMVVLVFKAGLQGHIQHTHHEMHHHRQAFMLCI